MKLKSWIASGLLFAAAMANAAPAKITVDVNQPGHKISPTLWGIFFEDINLSADGGIYPELVRNRSFEDGEQADSWKLINGSDAKSTIAIDLTKPLNPFNRRSLRLKLDGPADLVNEGFWGMNIVQGQSYTFKLAARVADDFKGPITVRVLSANDSELASGKISNLGEGWKYHTLNLTATGTDPKARLQLSASGKGTLFLDMVSLLPNSTWKNHGLRPDLAESLDALQPSFVRFPGGCWVEGDDMAHMYNWKKTIGDIDAREPLYNIWGYHATHGLGFHEYLQLTEDLGATPLYCLNVGMSHREVIPMGRMGAWVQDALDALEYANGPTNSLWGGIRAKNGHPAPFHLKYLEIGNENGGPAYHERWPLFYSAIKAKYPDVQLIANVWSGYPKTPAPDIIDEHYYDTPEFFMQQAHRYDDYDRKGPKIFIGEYAVTKNGGQGNLRAAIGEAAFMTGIERNSDVVAMASYAPLFVNLNHRRWNPDLINFDSSRWYGLPGYYVQKLFSEYRGDVTLPTTVDSPAAVSGPAPAGCVGVGTWRTAAEFKDMKVTSSDGKTLFASNFAQGTNGWKMLGGGDWQIVDGALQQTAQKEFVRAIIGDRSWTDYTYEVKARKIAGEEGFLILFHIGNDEDRIWWNLGGWNNSQHAIEMDGTIAGKNGSIQTGKWYDIRVVVRGSNIKCYLDGKLVHDVNLARTSAIFASATRNQKSGEIIVKVVNTSADAVETELNLNGAKKLAPNAEVIVLTSEKATDENSIDSPTKVSPKAETLKLQDSNFTHRFPGNSLTVLRLGAKK
ncbi:MAG: alpha-L-arabinofuranosidase C-terminal domain-containing protein [Verrucomicrobiota bacterium]